MPQGLRERLVDEKLHGEGKIKREMGKEMAVEDSDTVLDRVTSAHRVE